jgi:hypothetical protein
MEWLQTGFGLLTAFTENLQNVTTSNYSAIINSHTLQLTATCPKPPQSAVSSPMSSASMFRLTTNTLRFWLASQNKVESFPRGWQYLSCQEITRPLSTYCLRARGNVVVKALCYKQEDRGFETRWGARIFNLPDPSGSTRPETEKCFWDVERGRDVGLTTLPLSVSQLSRQCEILNISQLYRPPRPVMGIAFFYVYVVHAYNRSFFKFSKFYCY